MSETKQIGTLYLIPLPIAEGANHTLSPEISTQTAHIKHYFVENVRTARRFLRSLHAELVIDTLHFSEIDKRKGADTSLLKTWLKAGFPVGVMSEAGCPGVADPGSSLVVKAHEINAKVVPLTGPSSIILALMASGFNGQNFAFNGYLPVKEPARSKQIKDLESRSATEKQTQIFIETPYRNTHLLQDLLRNCQPATRLCIAMHVSSESEFIKSLTIGEWKKNMPALVKAPTVFLLYAQ